MIPRYAGYFHKSLILSLIAIFRILKNYKNVNIKGQFKKCFVHIKLATLEYFAIFLGSNFIYTEPAFPAAFIFPLELASPGAHFCQFEQQGNDKVQ